MLLAWASCGFKDNGEFCLLQNTNNESRFLGGEDSQKLAEMGWHCITVWECELKPKVREQTLDSIAFTLNHIYLQDHSSPKPYEPMEEEMGMPMAAENNATKGINDFLHIIVG